MLPLLKLIFLVISLGCQKTAGSSNCRASFPNQERVLIGHVIRILENKTFESCNFSCELEMQCFSINYYYLSKTCELNNASKDYFPDDLVSRKEAFYLEMVIRVYEPCANTRCENGGTCVISPIVQCKCPLGFSGLHCENLQALGMESRSITNDQIKASSFKNSFEAWRARLNGNSCWMPSQSVSSQSIEVKFKVVKTVVAIATQGAPTDSCWVTSYTLQWSDGSSLENDPKKYQANVDKNTVVTNNFLSPIRANWIRLHPRSWSLCIAMRLEFYGY